MITGQAVRHDDGRLGVITERGDGDMASVRWADGTVSDVYAWELMPADEPQIGRVTRTGTYLTDSGVESGTVAYCTRCDHHVADYVYSPDAGMRDSAHSECDCPCHP